MRILSFILCLVLFFDIATASAAEVKNLRSGQDGKRAFLQFDLTGMPGEKEAEVLIRIEVGGVFYTPGQLSLSGDFGKEVKVGVGRRIWWDLLKDMPAGYEGDIGWDLEVINKPKPLPVPVPQQVAPPVVPRKQLPPRPVIADKNPESPFVIDGPMMRDKSTGLVWMRKMPKPMLWSDVTTFINRMNSNKYAGRDNWRLPKMLELKKLAAYALEKGWGDKEGHYVSDYLNTLGFDKIYSEYSPSANNHIMAYGVWVETIRMWSGLHDSLEINAKSKDLFSVLLVSDTSGSDDGTATVPAEHQASAGSVKQPDAASAAPPPQSKSAFMVEGKTVVDTRTGLIWTKNANLASDKLTYDKAHEFVQKLNKEKYAGFSDWRVPTIREFKGLFGTARNVAGSTGKKTIKIIQETFEQYQLWYYWTHNTLYRAGGDLSGSAFAFDLEDGTEKVFKKSEDQCVLAVRGKLIQVEEQNR